MLCQEWLDKIWYSITVPLVNESMIVSDNKKVQMFIYIGFVLLETCDRLHRNKRTCVVLKIRTRHFFLDGKRLAPFWWSHYTVMSLPFCHQFIGRVTKARLIFLRNKYISFEFIATQIAQCWKNGLYLSRRNETNEMSNTHFIFKFVLHRKETKIVLLTFK